MSFFEIVSNNPQEAKEQYKNRIADLRQKLNLAHLNHLPNEMVLAEILINYIQNARALKRRLKAIQESET